MDLLRSKKYLPVAYTLWLLFGCLGLHHLYLGRTKQAIVWFLTFGMFFIGWINDFSKIPVYVDESNEKDEQRKQEGSTPPFTWTRLFGEFIVGTWIGLLYILAIPRWTYGEGVSKALIMMFPLVTASGVHLVGSVGYQKSSFGYAVLGAVVGFIAWCALFPDIIMWIKSVMFLGLIIRCLFFSSPTKKMKAVMFLGYVAWCEYITCPLVWMLSLVSLGSSITSTFGRKWSPGNHWRRPKEQLRTVVIWIFVIAFLYFSVSETLEGKHLVPKQFNNDHQNHDEYMQCEDLRINLQLGKVVAQLVAKSALGLAQHLRNHYIAPIFATSLLDHVQHLHFHYLGPGRDVVAFKKLVHSGGTRDEIRSSYLQLVKCLHPDKNQGAFTKDIAQEYFIEISNLYESTRQTHHKRRRGT